ncbi:MAG TPA: GlxA family transcriptional regulator [Alphaproteobacteria bacterium]|nr:GlxA family transcriptional regulator [Alphaproteobacteria bacterium]
MNFTDRRSALSVGFLVVPNYSMIAFANAVESLRMVNHVSRKTVCSWSIVSVTGQPVHASNGLAVVPTIPAVQAANLDLVFVCGGIDIHKACDEVTLAYLRRLARQNTALGALCTGSYVLARAGLLDGYRCAIHWENIAAVRDEFPDVNFSTELFVIDRDRYTASGGTAPLDLMLNLIAQRMGSDLSVAISEEFILERIRSARDQQRIPLLARVGAKQQKIIEAASFMEANMEETMSLDAVAAHVGLSRRHLERLFKQHLDRRPARYYLELRLNRARQLLLQTDMSIMEVTLSCGFQSPPHFSKCYKDMFGHPPSAERRLAHRAHSVADARGHHAQ